MKTKMLLAAALIGMAALTAHAGVHFGFSFGVPVPVPAPPAVVVGPPTVYAPDVANIPPCPGPDYTWVPGYWSSDVWVPGCWEYQPYYYGHEYWHRDYDRDWHGGYGHGWHGDYGHAWHGGYEHGEHGHHYR